MHGTMNIKVTVKVGRIFFNSERNSDCFKEFKLYFSSNYARIPNQKKYFGST